LRKDNEVSIQHLGKWAFLYLCESIVVEVFYVNLEDYSCTWKQLWKLCWVNFHWGSNIWPSVCTKSEDYSLHENC